MWQWELLIDPAINRKQGKQAKTITKTVTAQKKKNWFAKLSFPEQSPVHEPGTQQ